MTDREKLIALYDKAIQYAGGICDGHGCDTCRYGECEGDCYEAAKVDYLLANGVVVREKGEWLHVCGKGRHAEYECSECKIHVCFDEKIGGDIPAYKICPNCGADMKRRENR